MHKKYSKMKIAVINGPNINLLGVREPEVYGTRSLPDILDSLQKEFADIQFSFFQSNIEGELIDKIQEQGFGCDGIILNAGGYSHTSIAIRDAVKAVPALTVEVHISNICGRERFRCKSLIAPVCIGMIVGFGADSYRLAVEAIKLKIALKKQY